MLVTIWVIAYFPAQPPTAPSISGLSPHLFILIVQASLDLEEKFVFKDYWNDIKVMAKNPSFMLLVLIGGFQSGMLSAWQVRI